VASSASESRAAGQAGLAGAAGPRPLIGLTTYREQARTGVWDTEFALLHNVYVDCVAQAGGVPVLLPPPGEASAADAADRLAGTLGALILTGGSDVDPARYQQQPHEQTKLTRPWRDEWELCLLDRALAAGLPVLGICRGAQLLNVALGGTLDQHVPDTVGHRGHSPAPGVFGQTRVTTAPGSETRGLLGPEVTVACYHHQAIGKLAPGLEISGTAEDGTIEAVERPGRQFVLAVQWHPEQVGTDLRLFQALVTAASRENAARQNHKKEASSA
jgi:putative glutamine amidotransferase